MKNQVIANILYEIADILEVQEVQFKPIAYRRAAQSIESLPEAIEDVYRKKGLKGLKEIPGVGEHIALKIEEILKTGKLKYYEKLKKETPVNVSELMSLEGLGPKKIKLLYKRLGIKNLKDLEKAAKTGKLRKIKTLGEKTEENILKSIGFAKVTKKRLLLGYVWNDVMLLEKELKKSRDIQRLEFAGSFRRRKETIGDLDILAISNKPVKVMDYFSSLKMVKDVIAKGRTKSTVRLINNLKVDLRVVGKESFGSAMQYFIGNKNHNIKLRRIAIEHGYKLSEYGLFKGKKAVAGENEKDIYKKLGLQYIEPELRENSGEVEAGLKNKLPKLIQLKDIKGDTQVHSRYSDGNNSIEEMVKKCVSLGYEYVVITDHLGQLKIAHGMSLKELEKQKKEIDKLNKKYKIKILHGAEIDIREKGKFDIPDSVLKKLDVILAGLHSGLRQDKSKITKRVLDAMENKHVDILAHPTGRIIDQRETNLDIIKVIDKAKETGTVLEVNGFPTRLDLKDIDIREAVDRKVKLSIGTDAHDVDHLEFMKFGVFQARRGWCKKSDVVNCLGLKEFLKKLK